jgi:DNA-binding NarL/FixJ family response regulator
MTKIPRIRVLIVDDHPLMREGIRSVVGNDDHLEVIGEAGNGETALQLVRDLRPDVVVMDINMPDMNGIETTWQMKSEFPHLAIVGLSVHESQQMVQDMANAGVSVYLAKETAADHLCQAIEAAFHARKN